MPSNQQHLNGQNHKSSHSHVDSIWDKCQKLGTLKQAATQLSFKTKFLHNVDELEKTSSLFKHVVPDNVNFLTQNNYGSFTNSQHSLVIKISLRLTDAQCCCHHCCSPKEQTPGIRKYQFNDEGTVLFEQSFDDTFS